MTQKDSEWSGARVDGVIGEPPLVRVVDLCKRFGSLEVLRNVNLDVHVGEKLAIIGPSGSGKTTLLRCINYIERPSSGHVLLNGTMIGYRQDGGRLVEMRDREIARLRARMGMVFQRFNLWPHLTALENVAIGPIKVLRLPSAVAREEAETLLAKVGLADKCEEYPERLSGGQQQRVAIARCLAMKPQLVLFDEATSALDPELVGEVLVVMRKLAAEGMTMLIVTHEMRFAEDVADQVIVMDHGEIIDRGLPHVLFRNPENPRTRAFLRAVIDRQEFH
jgi:polar amino acid transport system ATP-binding protein